MSSKLLYCSKHVNTQHTQLRDKHLTKKYTDTIDSHNRKKNHDHEE
jgi:hypothetical protein